ncbi:MAG: hypothetical protein KME45_07325 [Stenomitos rutilans HA7619-LM2]|nr:hypothetical protein [Stenomitos rutilans HA7619-LM2]
MQPYPAVIEAQMRRYYQSLFDAVAMLRLKRANLATEGKFLSDSYSAAIMKP